MPPVFIERNRRTTTSLPRALLLLFFPRSKSTCLAKFPRFGYIIRFQCGWKEGGETGAWRIDKEPEGCVQQIVQLTRLPANDVPFFQPTTISKAQETLFFPRISIFSVLATIPNNSCWEDSDKKKRVQPKRKKCPRFLNSEPVTLYR